MGRSLFLLANLCISKDDAIDTVRSWMEDQLITFAAIMTAVQQPEFKRQLALLTTPSLT